MKTILQWHTDSGNEQGFYLVQLLQISKSFSKLRTPLTCTEMVAISDLEVICGVFDESGVKTETKIVLQ